MKIWRNLIANQRTLQSLGAPLPGDGSRIPWLTKQADANALNLAPEGRRRNTCET